mmetsp:Transcript_4261/g.11908  ORF Transcript_4261/g.11908 Transcript_4261/m.11908 type:complete len:200 (+) Transcript_4261:416-1015(+)
MRSMLGSAPASCSRSCCAASPEKRPASPRLSMSASPGSISSISQPVFKASWESFQMAEQALYMPIIPQLLPELVMPNGPAACTPGAASTCTSAGAAPDSPAGASLSAGLGAARKGVALTHSWGRRPVVAGAPPAGGSIGVPAGSSSGSGRCIWMEAFSLAAGDLMASASPRCCASRARMRASSRCASRCRIWLMAAVER